MEVLGVGPLELLFILLIALILMGPKDMVKAGHTIGRILRKTILSPTWLNIQRKVRTLPYQLMREAGLDELEDVRQGMKFNLNEPVQKASPTPQPANGTVAADPEPAAEIPDEWTTAPVLPTPPEPLQAPVETPAGDPPDNTGQGEQS